ncbi:MAG TPA: choice-of-anchor Q domain-containing protein, partial [Chthoniobacterales bacterium]|nr:choice-of-anchor Q domain-containing protein [Chthoniobacterales bacterium]
MKTRLLSIALLVCSLSVARAATITVNTTTDPAGFNPNITVSQLTSTVTLRDAVNAANNTPGNDEIVFPPEMGGQTIYLTQIGLATDSPDTQQSALNVTSNVVIHGSGVILIKDPSVYPLRLFNVTSNGNLTLENLTLQGGADRIGGAVLNDGVLTVLSSTIKNGVCAGHLPGFDRGAGIYSRGTLTVTGCTFSNNLVGTSGGAIYNATGTLTVSNTTFSNNTAYNSGGAILNRDTGGLSTISGCTFSGNQLPGIPLQGHDATDGFGGGAIRNDGVLAVNTSTFDSNKTGTFAGGAIYNNGSSLNLSGNTFIGNQVANQIHQGFGGAFYNQASATATNCTFTQNYGDDGTAINSVGTIALNHCTIVSQYGPTDSVAAAVALQGTATINNSIICLNYWYSTSNGGNAFLRNVSGNYTGGHNVIDNANPGLGPLSSNGGPTRTMPLLANSPAINAGIPTGVTTDQRGVARQDGVPDIGAFEYGLLPPSFTTVNATTFYIGITNTFGVIANALPPPTYSVSGTLPTGVTFDSSSGILSGSPAAGTQGTYPLTFTASNFYGQATQSFVLTVSQPDTVVTTAADEDNGDTDPTLGTGVSLREAINHANVVGSAGQIIVFSPALAGQTIQCTNVQNTPDGPNAFVVTRNMTILGLSGNSGISLVSGVADMRAFQVYGGATLTLNDLTLANWHSTRVGAVVYHGGSVRLNRCTVRDNSGPSIIQAGGFADATLENCTVVNNSGGYAMSCNGFYTLRSTTVTRNTGGGLRVSNNGATLINSIIAGNTNTVTSEPADYPYSFLRDGSSSNLFGTGVHAQFPGWYSGVNGNIVGVPGYQLFLGPLANNGGPTQTVALLPGSPAIDHGTVSVSSDQRGVVRPQFNFPDIGAYEFDGLHESLVVTTTADELDSTSDPNFGTGTSLREALVYARSLGGAHTITFAPSLAGQIITLSNGWNGAIEDTALRIIGGDITIDGGDPANPVTLVIPQGTQRRHLIAGGGSLQLKNLSFQGGNPPASNSIGGAVYIYGNAQLTNVRFVDNSADQGAGLFVTNTGIVQITNGLFQNNTAANGAGGGIINAGGTLTV